MRASVGGDDPIRLPHRSEPIRISGAEQGNHARPRGGGEMGNQRIVAQHHVGGGRHCGQFSDVRGGQSQDVGRERIQRRAVRRIDDHDGEVGATGQRTGQQIVEAPRGPALGGEASAGMNQEQAPTVPMRLGQEVGKRLRGSAPFKPWGCLAPGEVEVPGEGAPFAELGRFRGEVAIQWFGQGWPPRHPAQHSLGKSPEAESALSPAWEGCVKVILGNPETNPPGDACAGEE